jgi:transcription elongation factor GreA
MMITINGLEAKRYRVTAAGLDELNRLLGHLRAQRMEVADELHDISSQSNTSSALEDSTFSMDQNKAIELDGQIDLLERIIGFAVVVEPPKDRSTVSFGAQVLLNVDGKEHTYSLVGAVEADPSEGKISDECPLGQSLVGKKVGDTVQVPLPAKQSTTATVLRIS